VNRAGSLYESHEPEGKSLIRPTGLDYWLSRLGHSEVRYAEKTALSPGPRRSWK
jgi:hypothetical protein